MQPMKLAAGNWKMNGTLANLAEVEALVASHPVPECEVLICPPATLIYPMVAKVAGSGIVIGGQDCHTDPSGAHTGDISAVALRDAGADYVILGHSERRQDHGETNDLIARKAAAAHQAGLRTIICVGETEAERDSGAALDVVSAQLAASMPDGATEENTVIAYEPVWAIGTGRTPDATQITQMHARIRADLTARFDDADGFRILYGGSCKPSNAAEIFAIQNVDGALVGGASLTAKDFGAIISALEES